MIIPKRGNAMKALFPGKAKQEARNADTMETDTMEQEPEEREGEDFQGGGNQKMERQLRELLEAIEAVRRGDLTKRLRRKGYDIFGEIADSYNGMMESLTIFTSEVSRVSKEVGTEGKLGGQAAVPGVTGT